jgi:hypothetical protein
MLPRLKELRSTGRVIRCSRIGRKECIGHHLETRVNKASGLKDEGLYSATWTGEASPLRDEVGVAETRRRSEEAILLINSQQIGRRWKRWSQYVVAAETAKVVVVRAELEDRVHGIRQRTTHMIMPIPRHSSNTFSLGEECLGEGREENESFLEGSFSFQRQWVVVSLHAMQGL